MPWSWLGVVVSNAVFFVVGLVLAARTARSKTRRKSFLRAAGSFCTCFLPGPTRLSVLSSAPLPMAKPEEMNLSSERLAKISDWSDSWIDAGKIPGMLTLVARHGHLCFVHASGKADVESGTMLNLQTIMRVYSMTKPVTAVAIMILYERGHFQLDEPISRYLPTFARPRVCSEDGTTRPATMEITFHHLLTHTSGLSYGGSDDAVDTSYRQAGLDGDSFKKLSLIEFVDRLGKLPLAYDPGTSWRYSYSYDVLGRLVEILSGQPLDEFLTDAVFSKLGMVDTGFQIPAGKLERVAQLHEVVDEPQIDRIDGFAESSRFETPNMYADVLTIENTSTVPVKSSKIHVALLSLATRNQITAGVGPKLLAPFANMPLVGNVLTQLQASGIHRAIVVVGGPASKTHQEVIMTQPVITSGQLNVQFVDLGERYEGGFARSLSHAAPALKDELFLLCSPNSVFDADIIHELTSVDMTKMGVDAVALVEEDAPSRGVLTGTNVSVQVCQEGQENEGVASVVAFDRETSSGTTALETGLYLCSPQVFAYFDRFASTGEYFTLKECMQSLAADGRLGSCGAKGRSWFTVKARDKFCEVTAAPRSLLRHGQARGRFACIEPQEANASSSDRRSPSPTSRVVAAQAGFRVVEAAPSMRHENLQASVPKRYQVRNAVSPQSALLKPIMFSGGGGLLSTPHDYCRFCQMLLNCGELDGVRVLSRRTVEFMRQNHLPMGATGRRVDISAISADSGFSETSLDGIGFGLGWSVLTDPVKASMMASRGEHGWGGMASTFFALDPVEDLIVLSFAQLVPSDRYPTRRQLRGLVYQSLV
eukprot:TRINITY_DN34440_c0_g1_i1.p1 TRINITY_DN34440_c0_g1~~TRINITY_DN34440_c0_g1_i1.p1  ORF type:complete len:821 (-),score=91.88 TRINITY_DN34440_c0_g1_i1:248-2710(-)